GTRLQQRRDQRHRRRLAHVVGLRLERKPPHSDGLSLEIAEVRLHLRCEPGLLSLVNSLDRVQDFEIVGLLGRKVNHGLHVLRKAATAVPYAWEQERCANPTVSADGPTNLVDV